MAPRHDAAHRQRRHAESMKQPVHPPMQTACRNLADIAISVALMVSAARAPYTSFRSQGSRRKRGDEQLLLPGSAPHSIRSESCSGACWILIFVAWAGCKTNNMNNESDCNMRAPLISTLVSSVPEPSTVQPAPSAPSPCGDDVRR